ncbi:MAG: AAA family ATPase [Myxococcales bacterium]|nr:AAA family ATPase [Myxococcales bacterium]
MLISLLVENFRSFDTEQEFSMLASPRQTNFPDHLVEVPGLGERLVPVAAVFGANGAGKSNLVRVLSWVRDLVVHRRRFRFDGFLFAVPDRPSRFEFRLLKNELVLQYGVTCGHEGIRTEWLSTVSANGREKIVFERRTTPNGPTEIEFGKDLEGSTEKLEAVRVLGVRAPDLVLSKLGRELSPVELPPQVQAAYSWFRALTVVGPDAPYSVLTERLHEEAEFRAYASDLLRRLDPTISGVQATTKRLAVEDLQPFVRDRLADLESGESARILGRSLLKVDDHHVEEREVTLEHIGPSGELKSLDFAQESDGTKRLVHVAPTAFDAAVDDVVVVIDELDRSLHALLAREFVVEFLRRARGHRSQLIFTTHETHVLDQDLLRRDEVWFVEKNAQGATELHSLDDFKVRNDLRLDRSYLLGRFGGVPRLGSQP